MSRPRGAPRVLYDGKQRAPMQPQPSRARGRKNLYVCVECRGVIATEDVDDGTTPMFLACRAKEGCAGTMQSQMYPPEPWPAHFETHLATAVGHGGKVSTATFTVAVPPVTYEWFRPSKRAVRKMDPAMRDHVERGGLELRKREVAST